MKNFHIYKQPSGEPWRDSSLRNYVTDEISYARGQSTGYYEQNRLFVWLCNNNADSILLDGLANLAPLFPFDSYYNNIGAWFSPPPSGSGNAVVIVMGKHNGKVRMIGGNYFNEFPSSYKKNVCNNFFWETIDLTDSEMEKTRYIAFYIQQNMTAEDNEFARTVTQYANIAHTMPVYLMLVGEEGEKNKFWAMPAIVSGHHPSDMSHEKMWGVK